MNWFISMVLSALVWTGIIIGSVGFAAFMVVLLVLLFLIGCLTGNKHQ